MDTMRICWKDLTDALRAKSLLRRLGKPEGITKEEQELVSPDGIYRSITKYTLRGQQLYAMEAPKFRTLPAIAISFHAAKFVDYSCLENWLAEFFEGDISFLEDATISRIDLCVDLGISFDTAFRAITRRGSRKVMYFDSSKGKSIYFGCKPSQTVLYEKHLPSSQIDWWADEKRPAEKDGQIRALRLENRFFNNKCPIRSIKDFHTLPLLKPFASLDAKVIDHATMAGVEVRARRRVESFLYRTDLYGFDVAKKEENASGKRNFAKLVSRHLVNLDLDLEAAWQNRCQRFFGSAEVSNDLPS